MNNVTPSREEVREGLKAVRKRIEHLTQANIDLTAALEKKNS